MLRSILIAAAACLWPLASGAQGPEYRTVVIFGDTQNIVNREDPEFAQMVDWVARNKHAENIDAVLHVGDVIQSGSNLSTAFETGVCGAGYDATKTNSQCAGCSPRVACPEACLTAPGVTSCAEVCGGGQECVESCMALCTANCPTDMQSTIDGCFDVGYSSLACASCQVAINATENQWRFFLDAWRSGDAARDLRGLEEPADPIPYMVAMGNHENLGNSSTPDEIRDAAEGDSDVLGYADYFGPSHWRGLEALFDQPGESAKDRGFQYLGSFFETGNAEVDTQLNQAWRFRLGQSPGPQLWVNVIGHAPERLQGAIDWTKSAIRCAPSAGLSPNCDPNDPAILLSHRQLVSLGAQPTPLWNEIIGTDPEIYKGRVLLALQGHLAPTNRPSEIVLGPVPPVGMRTLNFIFNQQDVRLAAPPEEQDPRRWYLAGIRFWLSSDGVDALQVVRIDPLAVAPVETFSVTLDVPSPFYRRDWDGDATQNWFDPCPYDPTVSAGPDSDADGWGDSCDNCPDDFNFYQKDSDADGKGDACDPLFDAGECVDPIPANPPPDSNEDGRPDACQCGDVSGDGLLSSQDIAGLVLCANGKINCDPTVADGTRDGTISAVDLAFLTMVVNGDLPTLALNCAALEP